MLGRKSEDILAREEVKVEEVLQEEEEEEERLDLLQKLTRRLQWRRKDGSDITSSRSRVSNRK
jgi:hypothetical protein